MLLRHNASSVNQRGRVYYTSILIVIVSILQTHCLHISISPSIELTMPNIKVFSGNSNPELAKGIASRLGFELSHVELTKFSNKETRSEKGVDRKKPVARPQTTIVETLGLIRTV